MTLTSEALAKNRRALQWYEREAREYAAETEELPPGYEATLRRLVDVVPRGGTVLEVGSGPGWDADFVESHGVSVRRTDATRAFLEFQAERGKKAEPLNLLTDDLGGPYDGALALCVLLHIDRDQTDLVLRKVAGALRPGGAFLVSVREDVGSSEGSELTFWSRAGFAARLAAAGLRIDWDDRRIGGDGEAWLTYFARRSS